MKSNKITHTIAFFIIGLFTFVSSQAQEAKTLFINVPDSLCPLLTKVNREDCIDFLSSKMKAQVENRFGQKSEMTDLSKDYIRMQMTPETSWQMKVLALNDTTNVICTVATACAPACDSSIRFYTTDWKPLTDHSFITLPVMSDFLITPDSASIYEFDEASRSADILLMKVDMNKENTELAVTLSTPDYMSKETADLNRFSAVLLFISGRMERLPNKQLRPISTNYPLAKHSLMNATISGVCSSTL